MEHEIRSGNGKVSYADYIRVIEEYLITALGKRSITNIDYTALDELDATAFFVFTVISTPGSSTVTRH
jgi:hypothetical protein